MAKTKTLTLDDIGDHEIRAIRYYMDPDPIDGERPSQEVVGRIVTHDMIEGMKISQDVYVRWVKEQPEEVATQVHIWLLT